jgi:23S rRNA (guanosine2251-2'-O)-methyltransferase
VAGNSKRRGAVRKDGTKKGAVVGSGGQHRRALRGKGPTPPAEQRSGHPAQRKASAAARAAGATRATGDPRAGNPHAGNPRAGTPRGTSAARQRKPGTDGPETVVGRNPVLESLRANVPATALHVALGTEADERLTEAVRLAADAGIAILEAPRSELDRLTAGVMHQGIALTVPPYQYSEPRELLDAADGSGEAALLVALDGVTDPRNLGAVVRSAAAFGAHGVVLPTRRSAGVTAAAWRTSAGAAARIPIARATNLTRVLRDYAAAGLMIVGLDADGDTSTDDLTVATDPLLLVVGSEGRGLSRLVRDTCDVVASIPMAGPVESLNASVAAGIALAEVARRRRLAGSSA